MSLYGFDDNLAAQVDEPPPAVAQHPGQTVGAMGSGVVEFGLTQPAALPVNEPTATGQIVLSRRDETPSAVRTEPADHPQRGMFQEPAVSGHEHGLACEGLVPCDDDDVGLDAGSSYRHTLLPRAA